MGPDLGLRKVPDFRAYDCPSSTAANEVHFPPDNLACSAWDVMARSETQGFEFPDEVGGAWIESECLCELRIGIPREPPNQEIMAHLTRDERAARLENSVDFAQHLIEALHVPDGEIARRAIEGGIREWQKACIGPEHQATASAQGYSTRSDSETQEVAIDSNERRAAESAGEAREKESAARTNIEEGAERQATSGIDDPLDRCVRLVVRRGLATKALPSAQSPSMSQLSGGQQRPLVWPARGIQETCNEGLFSLFRQLGLPSAPGPSKEAVGVVPDRWLPILKQ